MKNFLSHPFFRNSAIMFAGTMVTNVLAYVYHLAVGRILGPVGYGELAALISIFYILNSPSTVLQNVLVKFFSQLKAKNDEGQARRLLFRITWLLLIVEAVCFVVLLPFVPFFAKFLHIEQTSNLIWLYLMFATFLFSIINISVLQAFQKFFAISVVTGLGGILRLALGAPAAFFGVGWTLISNVLASIIAYGVTFLPLRTLIAHKEKPITISLASAVYYSVPTLVAVFCVTALYSQDVVLVKHFFSAAEAGLYSSLSVLGKIIFFASSSLTYVAFPMLAERREQNRSYGKIVGASLVGVAIMSFGLTVFYYLFPSFVVNLLFGNAFSEASQYLGPFGLFISFYTMCNLFTTMYLALGKTSVWILTAVAAVGQAVIMSRSHESLSLVIWNNTLVVAALFVALLIYYPYATRRK